jgi:hypothetical protein
MEVTGCACVRPAVAGRFYPDDPDALAALVDALLRMFRLRGDVCGRSP